MDDLDVDQVADELARARDLRAVAQADRRCCSPRGGPTRTPRSLSTTWRVSCRGCRRRSSVSEDCPEIDEFAGAELGGLLGLTTRRPGERLIRDALLVRHRHPRLWEADPQRRRPHLAGCEGRPPVRGSGPRTLNRPRSWTPRPPPSSRRCPRWPGSWLWSTPRSSRPTRPLPRSEPGPRPGAFRAHRPGRRARHEDPHRPRPRRRHHGVLRGARPDRRHSRRPGRPHPASRSAGPPRCASWPTPPEPSPAPREPPSSIVRPGPSRTSRALRGGRPRRASFWWHSWMHRRDRVTTSACPRRPGRRGRARSGVIGAGRGSAPGGPRRPARRSTPRGWTRHGLPRPPHRRPPCDAGTRRRPGRGPRPDDALPGPRLAGPPVVRRLDPPAGQAPPRPRRRRRAPRRCLRVAHRHVRAGHRPQPLRGLPLGHPASRHSEDDHVIPFRPGRTKQTRLDNNAKLGKRHHRIKTFGGWQLFHPEPGVYLWRTKHGHWLRVDADGTHHLGRDPALDRQHLSRDSFCVIGLPWTGSAAWAGCVHVAPRPVALPRRPRGRLSMARPATTRAASTPAAVTDPLTVPWSRRSHTKAAVAASATVASSKHHGAQGWATAGGRVAVELPRQHPRARDDDGRTGCRAPGRRGRPSMRSPDREEQRRPRTR